MSNRTTRRTFIRHIGFAGAALPLALPPVVRAVSANSRINIAGVGVGGKGWEDINESTKQGKRHNLVAICDPDQRRAPDHPDSLGKAQLARPIGLGGAANAFPNAAQFADWRKMFDRMHGEIDAVTVSTPDHMHAPIALTAMQLGKHVYCQKPLTYTVAESRQMRIAAQRAGSSLVTQMGTQHHSSIGYRCLAKIIQDGAIGRVRESHAWTKSPTWPQGMDLPATADPVPEGLYWDLWIGVASPRPFKAGAYVPFNWRGWIDFGTGALGDMGCHILDPVVWSLGLGAPRTVQSLGPAPNSVSYPEWTTVRWEFDATPFTAPGLIPVTWYDGGKQPPIELARMPEGRRLPESGTLYIGEKGVIVISHRPTAPRVYPEDQFDDYNRTELREAYESFEALDHYEQWTGAILGEREANVPFSYAGPLCETVQLGNIALRYPNEKLTWDAAAMRISNKPDAEQYVSRQYREGWPVPGLT